MLKVTCGLPGQDAYIYVSCTNNELYIIKLFAEIRPPSGAPVVVNFNILVVDINSINVEDMDFR